MVGLGYLLRIDFIPLPVIAFQRRTIFSVRHYTSLRGGGILLNEDKIEASSQEGGAKE